MRCIFVLIIFVTSFSFSQSEVRVLDVGNGLCNIIKTPDNKIIIYDAGGWSKDSKKNIISTIDELVDSDKVIDYLVLSHTDADHWGAVKELVEKYKVKKILRNDFRVGTSFSNTWLTGREAIKWSAKNKGTKDLNLSKWNKNKMGKKPKSGDDLIKGAGYSLKFICGFGEPLNSWDICNDYSKMNNAVSIVVKYTYKGNSVLLTGDAVGRKDCEEGCIATESYMIRNSSIKKLVDSDVIIAPHHGADNGSCKKFIKAVSPKAVIFSSGHSNHRHPRESVANRYLDYGVKRDSIFRTDLGDFEKPKYSTDECKIEWTEGRQNGTQPGYKDEVGDDNILIILPKNGSVTVEYEK